jgi:hypothetical protein
MLEIGVFNFVKAGSKSAKDKSHWTKAKRSAKTKRMKKTIHGKKSTVGGCRWRRLSN